MNDTKCTAGTASTTTLYEDKDKFKWTCTDDKDDIETCTANKVECKSPPSKGSNGEKYYYNEFTKEDAQNEGCKFTKDINNWGGQDLTDSWTWKCVDDNNQSSESEEETCRAYKTACGPAHNKNYNSDSWDRSDRHLLCLDSNDYAINEVETEDGWTWDCDYGEDNVKTGCQANLVECGTAHESYYLEESYKLLASKPKCTFGTVFSEEEDCTSGDDNCKYYAKNGYYDSWSWNCQDSLGLKLTDNCEAYRVGCGIADAFVTDKIIFDDDGDGKGDKLGSSLQYDDYESGDDIEKEGSYGSESEIKDNNNWKRCTGYSTPSKRINGAKGKWTWTCVGNEDDTVDENCEARHNCGLACQSDGTCYETVDYTADGSGCWTAEDVAPSDGNNKSMTWGVALDLPIDDNDNQDRPTCLPTGRSRDCLCEKEINRAAHTTGACPDGWSVPSADPDTDGLGDFPLLEGVFSSTCSYNRIGDQDNPAWGCSPAGSKKDGLRDWITFAAKNGDNYGTKFWTTNYAGYTKVNENQENIQVCYSRKPAKGPIYYQVGTGDSSALGRAYNDYNWNNDKGYWDHYGDDINYNYLRCVKDSPGQPIIIPEDELEELQCLGFGCWNLWF